jgi:hypothetical protein
MKKAWLTVLVWGILFLFGACAVPAAETKALSEASPAATPSVLRQAQDSALRQARRPELVEGQGGGAASERYSLGEHAMIAEDTGRSWTIEELVAGEHAASFSPSTSAMPAFGFTSSAWWLKVHVFNQDMAGPLVLEVLPAYTDYLDVYLVPDSGLVEEDRNGSASVEGGGGGGGYSHGAPASLGPLPRGT